MKEALKLALELAIMHHSDDGYAELRSKVRQLAKEALAQPEQPSFNEWTNAKLASHYFDLLKVVERYEKHGVTCQTFRHFVTEPCAECNCVAPITAIKEALAQPEQEPAAFSCLRCVTPKKCAVHGCSPNTWPSEYSPKRPWVGLTGFEQRELMEMSAREAVFATEAKLKEKNT